MSPKRKLIEVALPLEAINRESAREKSIRHGHPSTLHLWWARRPLAACRAVLFASLVDDPSSHPDRFPTEADQERERQRLFALLERLVPWEATARPEVLEAARAEILASCDGAPPPVLDPFAGGGSIPLEAQRLGLPVQASDLNPVAVLITKALVEIPPKFAGRPPTHLGGDSLEVNGWTGAHGLAEDVRYYGRWMRDEAFRRIGHLYPPAHLPDGTEGLVIAWLWARTVKCPNPACGITLPLMNTLAVCSRKARGTWLDPVPVSDHVDFRVRSGKGWPREGSVKRGGAICLKCETLVPLSYVRQQGCAGNLGVQLVCTVASGERKRVYMEPDARAVEAADVSAPAGVLETPLPKRALGFRVQAYGMTRHRDLFTARQLTALTCLTELLHEAHKTIAQGAGQSYAEAVATYLALGVSRFANRCSSQSFWDPGGETVQQVFARNALPMIWVYAEANPFSESSGNFFGQVEYLAEALRRVPASGSAVVRQADAASYSSGVTGALVTDPPYYDNVPYADLSDFFYVWLRSSLRNITPALFETVLTPKTDELIAEPARHHSWQDAAEFFEHRLRNVFTRAHQAHDGDYPLVLFYAFKQTEEKDSEGRSSTGWERMLEALLDAGLSVTGTWPVRTEQPGGLRELGRNALASSIVLVCRPRPRHATLATRRELISALRAELPHALRTLQQGNIAPVDLAQAAIGPGMAIFSRYAGVIEAEGSAMAVRTALGLINQALDEILAEQEGDFDPDTRFAVTWFEQRGMEEGPYGDADVLARAKNTSVTGMAEAGVLAQRAGKVRLLSRAELPDEWDPVEDGRFTTWEATQHLTLRLETRGEAAAAALLARLGGDFGERAKELAYRLFAICDRKGWAAEAIGYNALVVAWPEIAQQVAGTPEAEGQQALEL